MKNYGPNAQMHECSECGNYYMKEHKRKTCSKECAKQRQYRMHKNSCSVGDVTDSSGFNIYELECCSVDSNILKQAEEYESRSKYEWEMFRFFILLNRTRSGQFQDKPEGTSSIKSS